MQEAAATQRREGCSPVDSKTVVKTVGANVTSATFTGLNGGVSYHFHVRACNAAGCSAWFGPVGQPPNWTP